MFSSTLVGDARRVAVINDRLVGIGDSVFGATVIEIGSRSARWRYAWRDVLLELGEGPVVRRSETGNRHGAGQ